MSKGNTRCIEGRLYRHDPQHDDPYLETDIGQCQECEGVGCSDQEQARYWKGAFDRMAAKNGELAAACRAALDDADKGYPSDGHTIDLLTSALRAYG